MNKLLCKSFWSLIPLTVMFWLSFSSITTICIAETRNESIRADQKSNKKIIIFGKIVNIADAKKYLSKTSYLFLGPSKEMRVRTYSDGSTGVIDSNLPKASFSKDGSFQFKIDSRLEGDYYIGVQPIIGFTTGLGLAATFIVEKRSKERIIIKFRSETADLNKIDLQDVWLLIP